MNMFLEGILGVLSVSAGIIAVKTLTSEYWAWRNRRDLAAQRVLDALAGPALKTPYTSGQMSIPVYNPTYTTVTTSGTGAWGGTSTSAPTLTFWSGL